MSSRNHRRIPQYQHDKRRNLGRVTINGRDVYLGPYGTPESRAKYERVIAEWLLQGQELPEKKEELTIVELMACYLKYARDYYIKNGEVTREFGCIAEACRPLRKLYEESLAVEFGPRSLKIVRQKMVEQGWSRKYVNKQIGRIVRMFKWAVSEELIPASVHQALTAVEGLKKGRTVAKDHAAIQPVTEEHVLSVLERAKPVIADMIRLQRLTGCRPGEVTTMRPMDVNRENDVWEYRPDSHKTEHQHKKRLIFIGPKAQGILLPYLLRSGSDYCFSPKESEQQRRAERHQQRTTPLNQGNKPKKLHVVARRRPGSRYSVGSYRKAIHRICDMVGIPRWCPNQLRHSAATEIRREFGLDAAQVILGHSSADVTQVYAEADRKMAARVIRKLG